MQSAPYPQSAYSAPGPPSSQSPSEDQLQFSTHTVPGARVPGGVAGGCPWRTPQSKQSAPYPQSEYSAPGPPSSQSPSEDQLQISTHTEPGSRGGGGARGGCPWRTPQSKQS
ncbi:hypothetical protein Ctob_002442, partial [Chrysochromulina tobinii]